VIEVLDAHIKDTEAATIAYKLMRGAYSQTPAGYATLYGWIARHGFQPAGMPGAVYLTMPGQTPEGEAAWELWAPIADGPADAEPDEQECGVKRVEPHAVASAMHEGPYETAGPTYERLFAWIAEQGYRVAGPPREIYYSDPEEVPPEEYLTEVQIPVARTHYQ
jgi:effector-binding domain-containing protein